VGQARIAHYGNGIDNTDEFDNYIDNAIEFDDNIRYNIESNRPEK